MSVLPNTVLTLADLPKPEDWMPVNRRIALQDARFNYVIEFLRRRKKAVIIKSSTDDDKERGIDGEDKMADGALLQYKERYENYDVEYELIRDIHLPVDAPGYWGREYRNRKVNIKFYDLLTPDMWYRRFLMASLHEVAERAMAYIDQIGEECGPKMRLEALTILESRMRPEGWELRPHQDARGGHWKSLLYVRWYPMAGVKPPIRPIAEWKID